jgi:hypothetical protein
MIEFTARPQYNPAALWQPTNMKIGGIRVWSRQGTGGDANLHRVGRFGDRYFYSWSTDRTPNYI